jgi:hypothetical protein
MEWFTVVVVYAACDELLQALCNRYCSVLDFGADALGAAVAIAVIEVTHSHQPDRLAN